MSAGARNRKSASGNTDLSPIPQPASGHDEDTNKAAMRPTAPQRRYLERGLDQPGGKLPLFDRDGREVPKKTIASCIAHGWCEAWTRNPIKPEWLVCRLTAAGYRVLGREAPSPGDAPAADVG
jgi:hypothetical protein